MKRMRKKETKKAKRKDKIFITAVLISLAGAAAVIAITLRDFRFIKISSLSLLLILGALIIVPLPAAIALRYFWSKIKIGSKMLLTFTLAVLLSGSVVSSFFFIYVSPIESLTENPKNYLKTEAANSWIFERISEVFPDTIPPKAEKAIYYYNYSDCTNMNVDVYARWELADAPYIKEKERVMKAFPDARTQVAKDLGRVYIIDEFGIGQYEYLVFFYNDNTKTVAYAYSRTDNIRDDEHRPYFMRVEQISVK
ncbi:MAG: hypothetical protein GX824_00545 [Clostridiales bacterium]|nr:hypothetical protein [Clostridiales bacterium]